MTLVLQQFLLSTKSIKTCGFKLLRSGCSFNFKVELCALDCKSCVIIPNGKHKSVVSWTSIIGACASHGHGNDALMLFSMMKEQGVKPNSFTFTAVLTACRHSGLVDEGRKHFESMIKDYSIVPCVEHYACMVDLLGRAGCLLEAYKFIERMPAEPDVGVWGALLGACRIHDNIELAELVAAHLSRSDPQTTTPYALMLIVYAKASRWEDEARLSNLMRQKEFRKLPGLSFVEVNLRLPPMLT